MKIIIDKIGCTRNSADELFLELYDLLELYIACLKNKDYQRPFFKQSLDEILLLAINLDDLNDKLDLNSLVTLVIKLDYFCDFDLKKELQILTNLINSVGLSLLT